MGHSSLTMKKSSLVMSALPSFYISKLNPTVQALWTFSNFL